MPGHRTSNNLFNATKQNNYSIPELSGCADFLLEYVEESAILHKASNFRDPLIGDLIAKGSAKEIDKHWDSSYMLRRVVILASGHGGSDLCTS